MRYRPLSSVTTILPNLVGRSVVSAITQTPASGPRELVTTPARSALPIGIVLAGLRCCARSPAAAPATHAAMAMVAATFTCRFRVGFMKTSDGEGAPLRFQPAFRYSRRIEDTRELLGQKHEDPGETIVRTSKWNIAC